MNDMLQKLLGTVPPESERAIVIFPAGKETAVQWIGMNAEQVAELLYQMADEIVDRRIPPPDWRERIKGSAR